MIAASTATHALPAFPSPYRAMLAICSDLDETPDAETYFELMRFLNTTEETSMGPGVGLEVGNTIYFDMPAGHFSYWNTDEKNRERIRTLIRSGHIDCLHSYGDLATTRAHAKRALDELERHGCKLKVWVDHAVAPTNFGADIMQGHGDEVGHPAYHADLTLAHGIRYVWRGRVTSVIGQDRPLSFGGIADARHPLDSVKTLTKEVVKQSLARCGSRKYGLHKGNRTLRSACLRDGSRVVEFLRANPHWKGVSSCDTGYGIGQVLIRSFLDRLVERRGVCILYTHLGKLGKGAGSLNESAIRAFRLLADYYRSKKILVMTTRRLLDFQTFVRSISYSALRCADRIIINISSPAAHHGSITVTASELAGLTFAIEESTQVEVRWNGIEMLPTVVNPPDETGRASISVAWEHLDFPEI
jgi:hypothetical protein